MGQTFQGTLAVHVLETNMPSIVTLTTDFEEREPFVASAKGVLCTRCPGVQIVDLSHEIPRFNIPEAALFIAGAVPYFPKGTVHIVAVASGHSAIAVSLNGQFIVCPDNGVITLLAERYGVEETRGITNPDLSLSEGGQTYYARDVFAPAAALLAGGAPLKEVGDPVENATLLNLPKPEREGERLVTGRIVHVNRFGSLVTNIHRSFLEGVSVTNVEVGHFPVGPLSESYAEVEAGRPVALYGSAGYLEIAYNGDRADTRLNMGIGIIVNVAVEP
ncbi:MAG: SAM-dependent chlorinase/fluorinase [Gammaproteobacteria bacterium]|nr:SAM-dependent chlorinase/fluorinase [Gammaproteobacteria bacterium]